MWITVSFFSLLPLWINDYNYSSSSDIDRNIILNQIKEINKKEELIKEWQKVSLRLDEELNIIEFKNYWFII